MDAWGAAQTALQVLWPPDGRGVPWALLFLALLALAGLYEGAAFLTERLWGVRPLWGAVLARKGQSSKSTGPWSACSRR